MAEWSKARDSKSRRPLKGLEGSNPSPTATSHTRMLLVLTLMAVGMLLGFLLRDRRGLLRSVDPSISVAIFLLLFLLGVSVGKNEVIMSHLDTLGVQALVLSVGAVTGSVLAAFIVQKIYFRRDG